MHCSIVNHFLLAVVQAQGHFRDSETSRKRTVFYPTIQSDASHDTVNCIHHILAPRGRDPFGQH